MNKIEETLPMQTLWDRQTTLTEFGLKFKKVKE